MGAYWNRTGTVEVDLVGGDSGFAADAPLDARFGPEDLLAAWRG